MDWEALWEPNQWGECVATDCAGIAHGVESYLGRRGIELGVSRTQVARAIVEYVWRRLGGRRAAELRGPRTGGRRPEGWEAQHEDIWCQWLGERLTPEGFEIEVMLPVFGTDRRTWESRCDGWRDELFAFLPAWTLRSWDKFDEINPIALDEWAADDDAGSADG
jgi:hypothetical protein